MFSVPNTIIGDSSGSLQVMQMQAVKSCCGAYNLCQPWKVTSGPRVSQKQRDDRHICHLLPLVES